MSEKANESLSALLDNEASEFELHQILQTMKSDTEFCDKLRSKWRSYNLTKSVLNNDTPIDISLNVSNVIAHENFHNEPSNKEQKDIKNDHRKDKTVWSIWKPIGGFAVAAAVAFVVVFGIGNFNDEDVLINPQFASSESPVGIGQSDTILASTDGTSVDPEKVNEEDTATLEVITDQELNAYLRRHAELNSRHTLRQRAALVQFEVE